MLGADLFALPGRVGILAREVTQLRLHVEPATSRIADMESSLSRTAEDIIELRRAVERMEQTLQIALERIPLPGDGPLTRARNALTGD